MIAFAQQWIADLLGSDARRSVLRATANRLMESRLIAMTKYYCQNPDFSASGILLRNFLSLPHNPLI